MSTASPRLVTLAMALCAVVGLAGCNKPAAGSAAAPTGAAALSDDGYSTGNPDAKVKVIEFGSVTCPHCAHWEEEFWPQFKAKYIDTGKVRYTFKEVLIHQQEDAAASLLLRCLPADKYLQNVQALFHAQPQMFAGDVRGAMLHIAQSEGMSEAQFTACLSDTKGLQAVGARQQQVDDVYHVNQTPTFFINGKTSDAVTMEQLSAAIDPLLAK
jgi:protein-disulfide isomerase